MADTKELDQQQTKNLSLWPIPVTEDDDAVDLESGSSVGIGIEMHEVKDSTLDRDPSNSSLEPDSISDAEHQQDSPLHLVACISVITVCAVLIVCLAMYFASIRHN